MATCYQKHPFEIETEDHLTAINTKIFEIKKKIQLSEGQRKSHYEEYEAEKQQNNDLIETLKKEVKGRLKDLAQARALIGEDEVQIKKYLNVVCPIGNKNSDQIIHNLDLKVIELRKSLDLLKYERKHKKGKLRILEKDYEHLLIEHAKSAAEKLKTSNPIRKQASHLENEIHRVIVQWNEAELVKKKYSSIRQALSEDSVKFESSLFHITELLKRQREEIKKLEVVREEALDMRARATAALTSESTREHDAEHARATERAYYAHRFEERRRELEKLEKRIFPPAARALVRQDSGGSVDAGTAPEDASASAIMEDTFQRLMKLTGVSQPEEVFDRFRAQRDTSKRLGYLQETTEVEKLQLEQAQTSLMAELEAFKFAQVKDKDETQDQIAELKAAIEVEETKCQELGKKLEDINGLLMEIKKLLYDLCKFFEFISESPMPEWTLEPRDVQSIVNELNARYGAGSARAHQLALKNHEGPTNVSMPASGAASGVVSAGSVLSHSTPREDAAAAVPTYKQLLLKEPVKLPASDDEEDIPSRSYLKRQAQLIVDTKSRRKGFRPYPRK